MKRRISLLICTIITLLALSVAVFSQTTIIDSMDFTGTSTEITLASATETLLKDNITLKKAELDIKQAEFDKTKADDKLSLIKKAPGVKTENSGLYATNKIFEAMSGVGYESAKKAYDATAEELKAQLEQLYFSVLQAEEMVRINKDNVQITKDLHNKALKKYELGLIAKQDVLNSEVNVVKAEKDFSASENSLKTARMALNAKIGLNVMENITLKDQLSYKEFKDISIAKAVNDALANRYEIKGLQYAYEIQKWTFVQNAAQFSEAQYSYIESKVKADKAEKDYENILKNIEMDVRSNYLSVMDKQNEIKAGQKTVELAEEGLKIAKITFDTGMTTVTDVQRAQVSLQQAKLGLSKAILDYNLAVSKFEDSMGVGRKPVQ